MGVYLYSRALEIIQEEEYLDESAFDVIRRSYKGHYEFGDKYGKLSDSKKKYRTKRQAQGSTNGR